MGVFIIFFFEDRVGRERFAGSFIWVGFWFYYILVGFIVEFIYFIEILFFYRNKSVD